MYGIEILVEEHKNIKKLAKHLKDVCRDILDGSEVDIAFFRKSIDFIRNYADKKHHGKEEAILFDKMLATLGPLAQKLIQGGMLVEHDLGRLYISELEQALNRYEQNPNTMDKLDIITNACGYVALINRHIDKEDSVVFSFAERMLASEDKDFVDIKTKEFEEDVQTIEIKNEYILWLESIVKAS